MLKVVESLPPTRKRRILLGIDMLLVPVALCLALLFGAGGASVSLLAAPTGEMFALVGVMAAAAMVFSVLLGLPRIKLNAYEQREVLRTALHAVMVGTTGAVLVALLPRPPVPGPTLALATLVLIVLEVAARFVLRDALIAIYRSGVPRTRVLIYGAGQTGVQLASALRTDDAVLPIAFADDNPTLQGMTVAGLPVHAPARIESLIRTERIERVVLAMPSIGGPRQARIARRLERLGCEVCVLPSFAALIASHESLLNRIRPVDPGQFLGREGLKTDPDATSAFYRGRSVMVTGAGGSIGSELCRQLLASRPSRIVLFEVGEYALYQLEREMAELADGADTEVVAVLGSVTDAAAVRRTLVEHEVAVVLHAAAYKHVVLVEQNALAGLRNNAIGTRVVAEAAREARVADFILISTDKAVRPSNVMGASKRLAELIVQDIAARPSDTRFSMVRFGNVLGSSGSVIPLFEQQIARGGPVTLTHAEVTRYFMTLGEAARLVLLAGTYARGGEVFVLDMGRPVPIRELARKMIENAGYTVRDAGNPDGDIEIVITGLRRGEKLAEELVIGTDLRGTGHPKILAAREDGMSEIEVAAAMRALSQAIEARDETAARAVLCRWVPGYAPGIAVSPPRDGASGPTAPLGAPAPVPAAAGGRARPE